MKHPKPQFKLFVCTEQGNFFAYFVSLESAKVATATLKRSVVFFWVIRNLKDNKIIEHSTREEEGAKK